MKVCSKCGDEISTRDGVNSCQSCKLKKAAERKANKKAIDDAMRSMGLTKVRGAMGGTYWE